MQRKYTRKVFYILFTLIAAISVTKGISNALEYPMGSFDFQYDSAKLLLYRINVYDESLNPTVVSKQFGYEKYYGALAANQFPSLLFLLAPFVILPPRQANFLWMICNLLFTVIIFILMHKLFCNRMSVKKYWLFCCAVLAGTSWRTIISNGQHTVFAFAFWLLALYLSEKKQHILSSLALAISFFKYTLTVPLTFLFIYKRRWKEIIIAVLIHIGLTFFAAYWLDDSIINMIKKPLIVSSVLSGLGYANFSSILPSKKIGSLIGILVLLAALIICFRYSKKTENSRNAELMIVDLLFLVSLVFVYHRFYDYFVLIVPVLYSMESDNRISRSIKITGAFAFLYPNCNSHIEKLLALFLPASTQQNVLNFLLLMYSLFLYAVIAILIYELIKADIPKMVKN